MKVKEVSQLTGISVRALHHYDEIGLLIPDDITEAGYRIYSDENLSVLQQILFFRALGFSLKKIKELLESPLFDRQAAFEMQREMLIEKRNQLDEMIATIEKTIQHEKGVYQMANIERFKGFDFKENAYEQEARARWGDGVVDESSEKVAQFGPTSGEKMNKIYFKLAELRGLPPASFEAQVAIGEWFEFLNQIGSYSPEAFKGLGEMYIADERFMNNIDKFGEGLAQFMCDAMAVYAEQKR